jgi:heme exporter protein C
MRNRPEEKPHLNSKPISKLTGFGVITLVLVLISTYMSLVSAPLEAIQGVHQKIFYIHVPLAFIAYASITVVFIASLLFLAKNDSKWDRLARISAEIGILSTTIVLFSGSLWGRPVWGAWWSWSDARLVTTLVMWLIYMGYLMLRSLSKSNSQTVKIASVIGVLGFINVPITYFSVYLWTYLHPLPTLQSSTERPESSILVPFLLSFLAYLAVILVIGIVRTNLEKDFDQLEILKKQVEGNRWE